MVHTVHDIQMACFTCFDSWISTLTSPFLLAKDASYRPSELHLDYSKSAIYVLDTDNSTDLYCCRYACVCAFFFIFGFFVIWIVSAPRICHLKPRSRSKSVTLISSPFGMGAASPSSFFRTGVPTQNVASQYFCCQFFD